MTLLVLDHLGCCMLSESVRGTVCALLFTGKPRAIRRGERVFDAGDHGDVLFQLRSGMVKLTTTTASGDEMLLEVYYPDAVFGELCFCDEPHAGTATAVEDSEVVSATRAQLLSLLREQPDLALVLFGELASRLSSAYTNLQTTVFDAVVTRVAARLVELAAHGIPCPDGDFEVPHKLSHSDLAEMLGVRRETVTRAMLDLRRKNLISYLADGRLRISSDGLREFISNFIRTR